MEQKVAKSKSKSKIIIKIAVIVGVLIIPLLYSYFYLGAFWDPYARMQDVPVAVVNLDKGAEINGEKRNIGQEICDNLQADGSLKFVFTDEATAKKGVEGSDYYAEIRIPEDLTASIATASENTQKQHGTIQYYANQKRNYLAAQILETAMTTIKETVNGNINEEITATLTDKLYDVPDALEILQDGMTQLFDGSNSLKDGTQQLSEATITLSAGTDKLADGSEDLISGLAVFKNGTATLNDGAGQINDGAVKLKTGAQTLKNGTGALKDNIPALKKGVTDLNNGAAQLNTGADSLKDGTAEFDVSLGQYTQGVSSAADGTDALTGGIEQLSGGVDRLSQGVDTMLAQVESGSTDLGDGMDQLLSGAASLNTNLKTYTAGVSALISSYETAIDLLTNSYPYISDTNTQQAVMQYLSVLNTDENKQQLRQLKNSGALLTSGSAQIEAGIKTLQEESSGSMRALSEGLTQIQTGLQTVSTGVKQLDGGAQTLQTGLKTLQSKNTALTGASAAIASGASDLSDGAAQLNTGTSALLTASGTLTDGVTKLDTGAGDLLSGVTYLHTATAALAEGANEIDTKTVTIQNGAGALKSGIQQLDSGAAQLQTGASDLDDGANALSDGIKTAKTGVDDNLKSTGQQLGALDGLSEYTGSPVNTDTQYFEPVANYGSAFAPYFMSLSMWVGGLMIFFGIYLDYERKIKILSKSSDHVVVRAFVFMLLGLLQAVLLAFVIQHVLGIAVNHTAMLYFSCCLVSLSFISIIQFCLVHLGDAGKFVALLLLILQLTSCAGTFPVETTPAFFQKLYSFMPMTYSVQLFKEALSGTWNTIATRAVLVLAGIMIVFTLLTTLLSAYKNRQKIKKTIKSSGNQTVSV